jgi:hypothetical protein
MTTPAKQSPTPFCDSSDGSGPNDRFNEEDLSTLEDAIAIIDQFLGDTDGDGQECCPQHGPAAFRAIRALLELSTGRPDELECTCFLPEDDDWLDTPPAALEAGPEPASPLPFVACKPCDERQSGCGLLWAADGETVVCVVTDEASDARRSDAQLCSDRRYIVHACNNYPEALARVAELEAEAKQWDNLNDGSIDFVQRFRERHEAAKTHIAELEAEQAKLDHYVVRGMKNSWDPIDEDVEARCLARTKATPGDPTP